MFLQSLGFLSLAWFARKREDRWNSAYGHLLDDTVSGGDGVLGFGVYNSYKSDTSLSF